MLVYGDSPRLINRREGDQTRQVQSVSQLVRQSVSQSVSDSHLAAQWAIHCSDIDEEAMARAVCPACLTIDHATNSAAVFGAGS